MAENDAPEREDLISRSAVLKAIAGHIAGYDDHYMHCMTKCIPELIEKLPRADLAAPEAEGEMQAILDALDGDAIFVREEGGPVDAAASLAVSVAKLRKRANSLDAVRQARRETEYNALLKIVQDTSQLGCLRGRKVHCAEIETDSGHWCVACQSKYLLQNYES